jgi:hypothetical protein
MLPSLVLARARSWPRSRWPVTCWSAAPRWTPSAIPTRLWSALTDASGRVRCLTTALFLAAAACAILASHVLPPSADWTGWALAAINLAAVPIIYQGNGFLETVIVGRDTVSGFYSYISTISGLAYIAWLLAVGIAILTAGHKPPAQARQNWFLPRPPSGLIADNT